MLNNSIRAIVPEFTPASPPDRLIPAIALLIGARSVSVTAVNRDTGHRQTFGDAGPVLDLGLPPFFAAAEGERYEPFVDGLRTHWFEVKNGCAILRLQFSCDGDAMTVVLHFDEPIAGCRGRVRPHEMMLHTAFLLAWRGEQERATLQTRNTALSSALSDSAFGIIALDEEHRPVYMNAEAQQYIADGYVHLRRGRLRPIAHEQAVRFKLAVDAMLEREEDRHVVDRDSRVMLLPAATKQHEAMVVIAPVDEGTPAMAATALVYLWKPESHGSRGLRIVGDMVGLSGAEMRLMEELLGGKLLNEAAADLRIKPETARGYLKQAFLKTNTRRQSDLLAKVRCYMHGLRGRAGFRRA